MMKASYNTMIYCKYMHYPVQCIPVCSLSLQTSSAYFQGITTFESKRTASFLQKMGINIIWLPTQRISLDD